MAFVTAPDFAIRSIEWTLDRPSQSNVSGWTGRRTVVADPWHGKWRARVELAPVIGEANARALRSFLVRCKGTINTFRVYATAGAQNSNSGVTVSTAAAVGATTMAITGAATTLKDGELFTVGGQLCCCTADQSGSTLTFEPPLQAAAAVGAAVVTDRPYARVHMTASNMGWSISPGRLFGISFDVEEAILESDGGFDPASLFAAGEAGAWYDPSDLASMWQDSAGTIASAVDSPVGKLNDKSGRGNHATQATSAARPILRSSAGLYYLEFDGVDDFLNVTFGATIAQPFDRVSGVHQTSWVNADVIYGGGSGFNGALYQDGVTPQINLYAGVFDTAMKNGNLAVGANGVVTERFNAASSSLNVNRGTATTGNPSTNGAAGLTLGARHDGTVSSNIRLYGLIMRAGAMTGQQLSDAEDWNATKAGVTL